MPQIVRHRSIEILPDGNGVVDVGGYTVIQEGKLTIVSNGGGHQIIIEGQGGLIVQLPSGEVVIEQDDQS